MEYKTKGVCSRKLTYDIEDGKLHNVRFTGGCNGSLKGIAKLAEGLTPDEVIEKFENLDCDGRGTSCPDQLAKALKLAKINNE